MIRIKGIDHVGVAVADIDGTAATWRRLFGMDVVHREVVAEQGVEAAFLPAGAASIELVCPDANETVRRFLDRRGPGLHHVAFEVDGIDAAIADLAARGVDLIDRAPRRGARGHRVAFLHPRAAGGVLVELVEPERARRS